MTTARYDIHLNTSPTGRIWAAEMVLEEDRGLLQRVGFRYRADYLAAPGAFPLDPRQLPLQSGEVVLRCAGGMPGFLDDYLPDDWGRKVLARLALYRDQQRLNAHSAIDMLAMVGASRIGALSVVPRGETPGWELGTPLAQLARAEDAAQHIDNPAYLRLYPDDMSLLYLANAGSGVGGARPKALLYDNGRHWLAKFNRLGQDRYNNARVELACLRMAHAAGIGVPDGEVREGINGREVLLVDRFDIDAHGLRRHLLTINSLLKESASQRDHGGVFRYDDIAALLRRYSVAIEADLAQLLRLMLFNRAINNLDDHERNFSLFCDASGCRLAPAYDLVPSLSVGEYPVAGFGLKPWAPRPSEVTALGKVFGLPRPEVEAGAEAVMHAVSRWRDIAESTGVSDEDAAQIARCLMP
ncbi:HipA-like protein [Isoalcanivorax pacificus W11-5]|uniref:HipA-like protein n=1 Tax=Isoalcanivorax pacificus W11-5 TaxID=391936 RepID=A0A0B4XN44_9GAMM|nr:type II toxin-antitoxin system HipA family toxin [Isoalcanivorax pacificus]AJD49804.1 HipA-like protein [Isoalcanivorax pacificus W11-5]